MRSPPNTASVACVLLRTERDELAALDLHETDAGGRVLAAYVHRTVHASASPLVLGLEGCREGCSVEFATQFDRLLNKQLCCRPGELTEEGGVRAGGNLLEPL